MLRPRWITAAGNLGSIPELSYYEKKLEVTTDTLGAGNTVDESVIFTFQSGELPPGVQVVRTGMLQGVPVVLDPITVDETREYRFTIRATAADGTVVDRSFWLSINNVFPPVITPRVTNLGNLFDGSYFHTQLRAVEENPNAQLSWKIVRGQLPPGVTMTESGTISGYILLEPDEYESVLAGYDTYNPNDSSVRTFFDDVPYDSLGKSRNRVYSFTVEVSDGANVDSLNYIIGVAAKGLFTADQDHYVNGTIYNWEPNATYPRGTILRYNGVLYVATQDVGSLEEKTPDIANEYRLYQVQKIAITADNDHLTVDHDQRYLPVITTPPQKLPTLRQENNFAFKFDAIDFNGDDLVWSISTSDGSGFDKNAVRSVGFSQDTYIEFSSDGTVDSFLLTGVPEWLPGKSYNIGETVSQQEQVYEVIQDHTSLVNYPPSVDSENYAIKNLGSASVNVYSNFPEVSEFSVFGLYQPDSNNDDDQDPDIVELTLDTDYQVLNLGTQIKFSQPLPAGTYFVGLTLTYPYLDPELDSGVGFDQDGVVFDEGESRLPPVLSLDENGWLHGYLEPQQEEIKTYDFIITAEKKLISQRKVTATATVGSYIMDLSYVAGTSCLGRVISASGIPSDTTILAQEIIPGATASDDATTRITLDKPLLSTISVGTTVSLRSSTAEGVYRSEPVQYSLTVLGSLTDRIIWKSPEFLGSIINGSTSELKIEAFSELGQTVRYSLVPNTKNRLPQSLSLDLLNDGIISGRTTFRYFQLDNDNTTFDKNKTRFDNLFQFEVRAETANIKKVYKSSGRKNTINKITQDSYSWQEESYPNKIYLAYSGSTNFVGHEISGTNVSAGTTVIGQMKYIDDNGAVYTELTLSQLLYGEIEAGDLVYILDGVISSTKTFTLRVDIVHKEPYENLYFKAFPTLEQRQRFFEIIDDQDIFPDELIYRKNDPWFGKASTIKFLAAAGIKASLVEDYILAMKENHYWKQINFGEIKTAVAVDEYYNTKYEVVYIDIIDPTNLTESSVSERVELNGNPYIYSTGEESNVIYPSTFANMNANIIDALGYQARGVFPDWMTSVQPDKTVLGFRRAVVLAYTVPGAAKLIAYRLNSKGIRFSDIEFTIDRYQLDNALSKFYQPNNDQFLNSKETTFDRLTLGPGEHKGGIVDYAVEQSFDSINKRTVSYLKERGGIDGIKSFEDGELLVFAKQENYSNETGPYDGWIDYQNLYIGDIPNDGSDIEGVGQEQAGTDSKFGFDAYRVVPGIKNKSLTVEKHLLRATSPAGSTEITLPWLLGVSYIGKSVEAAGVAVNSQIISQSIDYENNAVVATLSQPLTQNINVGSMVTLRATVMAVSFDEDQEIPEDLLDQSLAVDRVPPGVINGMKIFGRGIPENTVIVDVIDNILVTNNTLDEIRPGTVISYETDNQRGGIWRIKISDEDLVTLEFVREVEFGEKIKVLNGNSNGFTFMVYDNNVGLGQTIPAYRRWSTEIETSGGYTVFDGNGTRFFDNRDRYQAPEVDDKYLKFPQIGVFE